jgi:hypothetical protein
MSSQENSGHVEQGNGNRVEAGASGAAAWRRCGSRSPARRGARRYAGFCRQTPLRVWLRRAATPSRCRRRNGMDDPELLLVKRCQHAVGSMSVVCEGAVLSLRRERGADRLGAHLDVSQGCVLRGSTASRKPATK